MVGTLWEGDKGLGLLLEEEGVEQGRPPTAGRASLKTGWCFPFLSSHQPPGTLLTSQLTDLCKSNPPPSVYQVQSSCGRQIYLYFPSKTVLTMNTFL